MKVKIVDLESLKKQLISNNKFLAKLPKTSETTKLINSNNKQIKLLTEEYYVE